VLYIYIVKWKFDNIDNIDVMLLLVVYWIFHFYCTLHYSNNDNIILDNNYKANSIKIVK